MNESRPWWQLSWPAVVAGLVMLGALLVKNLDGCNWLPYVPSNDDIPWTSHMPDESFHNFGIERYYLEHAWHYGWPSYCCKQSWYAYSSAKVPVWPEIEILELRSMRNVLCDVSIGFLVVVSTLFVVDRWQRQGVIRCRLTLKGIMSTMAMTGATLAIAMYGDDFLWTFKPIATGLVFIGIFLTCFAVIDWIGGLWHLLTR